MKFDVLVTFEIKSHEEFAILDIPCCFSFIYIAIIHNFLEIKHPSLFFRSMSDKEKSFVTSITDLLKKKPKKGKVDSTNRQTDRQTGRQTGRQTDLIRGIQTLLKRIINFFAIFCLPVPAGFKPKYLGL